MSQDEQHRHFQSPWLYRGGQVGGQYSRDDAHAAQAHYYPTSIAQQVHGPHHHPHHPQPYATAQNYPRHSYFSAHPYHAYPIPQYHQPPHPAMSYPQYGNTGYNYQYPPGHPDPYAQQQHYQPAPTIRNPFAPPPPAHSTFSKTNANFDPEQEASIAQWHANYAPQDPLNPKNAGKGDVKNPGAFGPTKEAVVPQIGEEKKGMTVMRKGGGKAWEDKSLLEWDPNEFRIQVGNLAGEVTDDSLAKAFEKYGVSKARVIRDKTTTKSKGYGFVSFKDGELGFKAAREMAGKYIGSHPVTIQRSKADLRPTKVKENQHQKGRNNKNRKGKEEKAKEDPLRASTGAHIEKKPVRNPAGYKMLG